MWLWSSRKIDFVDIDEPTVSMTFSVNNGPFAGKEGQFITSRHIRDRLFKELERNVSLRVKENRLTRLIWSIRKRRTSLISINRNNEKRRIWAISIKTKSYL